MAETKKKGRPTKAELERKARLEAAEKRKKANRQFIALVLFAFGLIFIALAFIEGQNIWTTLHEVMLGVFGLLSYAIGAVFIYMGIAFSSGKKPPAPKVLKAVFLTLTVSGALLIFGKVPLTGEFLPDLQTLYDNGTQAKGGGALSATFGWTLWKLGGGTVAKILIVVLLFVAVMLMTGKTVTDLVNFLRARADNVKERQTERAELRAQREAENPPAPVVSEQEARFDINVQLDERSKTSASIDIPLEEIRQNIPQKTAEPKAKPIAPGSRIDIELGPEYKEVPPPIDVDILEMKPRAPVGTGPAADVTGSVFEREEMISQRFTAFGENPELDELITREKKRVETAVKPEPAETPQPLFTEYKYPPLALLAKAKTAGKKDITEELRSNAESLVATLASFGVRTRVVDISRGPTVTRYELQPEAGVRLSRIVNLSDDLALNLAAMGVRIEAPIPGKAAVGIEVPNKEQGIVNLRTVLETEAFRDASAPLTISMGMDISGGIRVGDISRMPHMLIAGSTGMGKSVFINSLIISLVYKSAPEDVQLILIDPKMVEFAVYRGLPHLPTPVVTDPGKAAGALNTAVAEMLRRYKTFADCGARNIEEYNVMVERGAGKPVQEGAEPPTKKPRWVVVIDELADLMMTAPRDVENAICRIAQMGRAAGIHLVVATQRPSVDVVTGTIKNNIPTRVAFRVSSQVDSRTILDGGGAEKLIGHGDMLFQPVGNPKPIRLQGCYISEEEVSKVVDFLKRNHAASYNEALISEIEANAVTEKGKEARNDNGDPMIEEAIEVIIESGQASTSMLQRRLRLGYARAARIIDELEAMGIVGPQEGSKPRTILMTRQQWQERNLNREQ